MNKLLFDFTGKKSQKVSCICLTSLTDKHLQHKQWHEKNNTNYGNGNCVKYCLCSKPYT